MDCQLCQADGGEVLHSTEKCHIVLVDDAHYPGFCRVIWNSHVQEMTDLCEADRDELMRIVWKVERAVRDVMRPDKVNVASLGNVVPHLHWHVIPRYRDDVQFPGPIWALPQREPDTGSLAARIALLPALRAALLHAVAA